MGNKVDLVEERKISFQDAEEMANQHNMRYFEASAKSNQNIDVFMSAIMNEIYSKRFSSFTTQRLPTFKLRPSDVNRETTLKKTAASGKCKC